MNDKNDPIIAKWIDNYKQNLDNEEFSKQTSRPLIFLSNNKFYYNVPVVLVAAGPSVDKNIQNLKKYQKNAIILSADVALYKLLENDIFPDFTVNIDPSDMFHRFWKGLNTSKSTLVCPTTVNPFSLEIWKGNKFFFNQIDRKGTTQGTILKRLLKSTDGFGNVINRYFIGATMLQIATIFNPRPAILVGYDFAYSDGKAYCDGFLERKIYDDTLPDGSPEQKAHIENLKKQEVSTEVEDIDIHGKKVYTSKLLQFYRNSFVRLIHYELKLRHIINATEGGILTGMPVMKLENALDKYCKDEIEKKDIFALQKRKKKRKK